MKATLNVMLGAVEAEVTIFDDGDIFDIEQVIVNGKSLNKLGRKAIDMITEQYYAWAFSYDENW